LRQNLDFERRIARTEARSASQHTPLSHNSVSRESKPEDGPASAARRSGTPAEPKRKRLVEAVLDRLQFAAVLGLFDHA